MEASTYLKAKKIKNLSRAGSYSCESDSEPPNTNIALEHIALSSELKIRKHAQK